MDYLTTKDVIDYITTSDDSIKILKLIDRKYKVDAIQQICRSILDVSCWKSNNYTVNDTALGCIYYFESSIEFKSNSDISLLISVSYVYQELYINVRGVPVKKYEIRIHSDIDLRNSSNYYAFYSNKDPLTISLSPTMFFQESVFEIRITANTSDDFWRLRKHIYSYIQFFKSLL